MSIPSAADFAEWDAFLSSSMVILKDEVEGEIVMSKAEDSAAGTLSAKTSKTTLAENSKPTTAKTSKPGKTSKAGKSTVLQLLHKPSFYLSNPSHVNLTTLVPV